MTSLSLVLLKFIILIIYFLPFYSKTKHWVWNKWLRHTISWRGQTMNGSMMDLGAANVRVNHTQARADRCSRVKSGRGRGHAGRMVVVVVVMQGAWNSCCFQHKLTLNSSTSSSCKREVWRLKRDSETSSGVRVDKTMLMSCHDKQTGNDWRWEDNTGRWTSPHINLNRTVCVCVWWLLHGDVCATFSKHLYQDF